MCYHNFQEVLVNYMHSDKESFSKSNSSFKFCQPFIQLNIDNGNVISITFRKHDEVGTFVIGGSADSTANVATIFKKNLLRICSKIPFPIMRYLFVKLLKWFLMIFVKCKIRVKFNDISKIDSAQISAGIIPF